MKRLTLTLLGLVALSLCVPRTLHAQSYPFAVVAPEPDAAAQLAREYDAAREQVWCVTDYVTREERSQSGLAMRVYHVTRVQLDTNARGTRVSLPGQGLVVCRRPDGTAMPTIHSHPPLATGCQFSPEDIVAVVGRHAAFDGVLCAPSVTTWLFFAHVSAILQDAAARELATAQ